MNLLFVAGVLFPFGAAGAQNAATPLPNAPQPVPGTRSNAPPAVERRQWEGVVEPGETVPPLTARDKLLFPFHEEFRPLALVPVLISSTYGVWHNDDPKLGTDASGFGERVGEAALRQASIRVLSDGLLPVVFHQDPRYYRLAYGTVPRRVEYALRRVVIAPQDSGKKGFNFSDILGRGMAAALTQAYYPEASIRPGVVYHTWGISLAGSAGVNIFQEFWPDIKVKVFKLPAP